MAKCGRALGVGGRHSPPTPFGPGAQDSKRGGYAATPTHPERTTRCLEAALVPWGATNLPVGPRVVQVVSSTAAGGTVSVDLFAHLGDGL